MSALTAGRILQRVERQRAKQDHDAAITATCVRAHKLQTLMQVAVIDALCCVGPGGWWWL